MISGLKPYPAYKDSGVPWLGEVPSHWTLGRLKSWVQDINVQASADADGTRCIALENVESWTGRIRFSLAGVSFDSQVKRFQRGDVLFGKLRPYLAKVARPAHEGVCVGEFLVLRPRTNSPEPAFLENMLRSKPLIDVVNSSTFGAKMPRANWDFIGSLPVALPPRSEQLAIAVYLDYLDRRIRSYIRAKRKVITLLDEQKQAIIDQAVARGLDPNVRLKPSGLKWPESVPEQWSVVRLKDVATVQTGLTLGKDYRGLETEPYPYLRVANVQHGRVDLGEVKTLRVPKEEAARATLRPGDVLMTEGGDIDKLGRGCVWHGEIPGCLHQNHVFAVRCRQALIPEFLAGLMISRHGRAYFQRTAKQTTNLASTNSTILRAFPILLPPRREQEAILSEIGKRTIKLEAAVSGAEREISRLREYRTRLIADVVTGKLDVRETAANLPDEAVEEAAPEEDALLEESEPLDDDSELEEALEEVEP